MKYRITHTTKYSYSSPASLCQNKVHLAPRALPGQRVLDYRLVVSPDPHMVSSATDYFGNRVDYFAITKPHHGLSVTSTSQVELLIDSPELETTGPVVANPVTSSAPASTNTGAAPTQSQSMTSGGMSQTQNQSQNQSQSQTQNPQIQTSSLPQTNSGSTTGSQSTALPANPSIPSDPWEAVVEKLQTNLQGKLLANYFFAFPSKFVPVNSELSTFAKQSFTPGRPIYEAALDLTDRIYKNFKYDPKATTVSTPVMDVFEHRSGVCQDFAHLQIACLRSIGLAARYVSGYLRTIPPPGKPHVEGSDESHAWLSLYCGSNLGWVDFDPTNNLIPRTDHVTVGWGRDYADLCPIQGVFIGGGQSAMQVSVDVKLLD